MSNLRSYKKRELIKLVNGYESDIDELRNEISKINLSKTVTQIEYVILDKEEDDFLLTYLKKRLKAVKGFERKKPYQMELDRLMLVR